MENVPDIPSARAVRNIICLAHGKEDIYPLIMFHLIPFLSGWEMEGKYPFIYFECENKIYIYIHVLIY